MICLVIGTVLLSGCTTTVVKPVTLPKAFVPQRDSVKWLDENNAPDYVINDFVDCTAQGKIIKKTSSEKPTVQESWDIGGVLSAAWAGITSFW